MSIGSISGKKILVVMKSNPNLFPSLFYLSNALGRQGAQLWFVSAHKPDGISVGHSQIQFRALPKVSGIAARIPLLRSNAQYVFRCLKSYAPDLVIAQEEFILPMLLYKAVSPRTKVGGFFYDYNRGGASMKAIGALAHLLDIYIDVCHLRLAWRQADWPKMKAATFVMRLAPLLRPEKDIPPRRGTPSVVYVSSPNLLRTMNTDRFSRFVSRLCERGVAFDWYLSGFSHLQPAGGAVEEAGRLVHSAGFSVRPPVAKADLMAVLSRYDAGLFWAPLADPQHNPSFFLSAASNKIGEYLAAGLVVAHTGNPGLSWLPGETCVAFDPADPEAAADRLAETLFDSALLRQKRQAALRYHLEVMNFEAQAAPIIRYLGEAA